MHVYLDIETLPADWSPEQIAAAASTSVPGNYTKPDSIAKWIEEHAGELHRRTALDSLQARILCIGVAIEDGPVETVYNEHGTDAGLHAMFDALLPLLAGDVVYVGHNIAGFDLPMLLRAAWRLEHPLARLLPRTPRSRVVVDTQELWRATEPTGSRARLADIAAFLGLEGKGEGLSGDKVYDAWLAGEHDRIRAYCAQDVELVRTIHGRIW